MEVGARHGVPLREFLHIFATSGRMRLPSETQGRRSSLHKGATAMPPYASACHGGAHDGRSRSR